MGREIRYLIQHTLCSHLLVTAVFCSALYQNDKERPCIQPHITNSHEELALLKTILILNQEPLGHLTLFADYHPPPSAEPTNAERSGASVSTKI